ncbi:MAG: N-acyl homoserine lactonase family protein [Planctomycetes bacterium]|nr:N-acyl homoserine lactonase family protein [Planctomycetota bacterium]
MKMQFHPFTSGTYVVNRGIMDDISWGERYEHPIPMFAIRHPKGIVVFDTGHNHRGLVNPQQWYGKSIANFHAINISEEDCLPAKLKSVGIDPADVTHVVMSHLHIDHAGEMESFPKATFIVRASELRYAWWPALNQRYTYVFNDLKETRFFEYLELRDGVDFDIFGDGTLVCIHTPGHTPGHQSLIVRLPDNDRPMLLCADACYTPFTLQDNPYCAGLMWNLDEFYRSLSLLRHYRDTGYELWYGHDMAEWQERIKPYV